MKTNVELDETDWKLLVMLQEDGRLSLSEMARRVGMTAPAVSARVRNMEAEGVIRGYHAEVDLGRLGYALTVIIRLAVPSGTDCTTVLDRLEEIPEVLEAYRITGEESAVIRAAVASSDHLERLINRLTRLGKPITGIATSGFRRVPAVSGPVSTDGRRANDEPR